jgi:hypothetical protein
MTEKLGFKTKRYKTTLYFKSMEQRRRFLNFAFARHITYERKDAFEVVIKSENEEKHQCVLEFIEKEKGLFGD